MKAIYAEGQLCAADGCTFRHEKGNRSQRLFSGYCPKHWQQNKPANHRDAHLKRKFGISEQEYRAQLEAQGGVCAVCGASEPGGQGEFHVDHDHASGALRGLLCMNCNQGLGRFKDEPERLVSAAAYLLTGGVWNG